MIEHATSTRRTSTRKPTFVPTVARVLGYDARKFSAEVEFSNGQHGYLDMRNIKASDPCFRELSFPELRAHWKTDKAMRAARHTR